MESKCKDTTTNQPFQINVNEPIIATKDQSGKKGEDIIGNYGHDKNVAPYTPKEDSTNSQRRRKVRHSQNTRKMTNESQANDTIKLDVSHKLKKSLEKLKFKLKCDTTDPYQNVEPATKF